MPPDVELFSDLAGQDCVRELLLDLPYILLRLIFNFLSLNINGFNDHLKQTALVDWLKCMKVDVACLQKTHAP